MRIGKMKGIFILVVIFILSSIFATDTLLAQESIIEPIGKNVDLKQFKFEASNEEIDASFNDTELEVNKQQDIAVKDNDIKTSGSYLTDSDRFINSSSLTESNPDDWWFFTVDSDRSIVFQIDSENSDYLVQLYQVDWSSGSAYPTTLGGGTGQTIAHSSLPEGDWALRVFSQGEVGSSYTIRMNATNPEGAVGILSSSTSLQYLVLHYENGEIYSNGSYIANLNENNEHLEWRRNVQFNWDGNYNRRLHSVSEIKIKSISAPVRYRANYASSDSAILIYLDTGTLFTHFESYFRSGPPTQYENSFVDTIGKTTPRYLDEDDLANWGDHIIVYDFNTNQSIDFFSVLNFYYASGAESIPTITYLN